LFEQGTIFHNASPAASTALARPRVFAKGRTVAGFEPTADAILQSFEVIFCAFTP
jgi:hypothetical protein